MLPAVGRKKFEFTIAPTLLERQSSQRRWYPKIWKTDYWNYQLRNLLVNKPAGIQSVNLIFFLIERFQVAREKENRSLSAVMLE